MLPRVGKAYQSRGAIRVLSDVDGGALFFAESGAWGSVRARSWDSRFEIEQLGQTY